MRAGLLAGALALLAAVAGCGPSGGAGAGTGNGPGGGAGRPPGAGPAPGTGALPPVVDRVPARDGVVFLTYDDGAERDPRFVDLVRERRLPVSLFLTDTVAGPGYAHFARLRSVGASLQNHTLDHPALRGLPYAGQRAEICGQQRKLTSRFGVRPRLFRPPYGTYDTTTLRAAADCGIATVVLWRVTLEPDGHLTYTDGPHHLTPGDIIAVPSGEAPPLSLTERTTRLLGKLEERGLKVGRLEDHISRIGPPTAPGEHRSPLSSPTVPGEHRSPSSPSGV
ncbi:polysaccharide deacetylase family protein [Streptomyces sp. NPDC018955]|uniref:polysaccharide deacetylase family protein n=1 Tax=Streptomyces sp. NPDC018955 TaxID=3365055 RepID=UPI0037BBF891